MVNPSDGVIHHTERVVVKPKFIVILDREDYQVFELQDNGIYRFYANAGYSFETARSIARAMNEKNS